ncbi:hypothetical protein [Neobacillus mesonae]|uniref:Uncharacterized protein n=1 Tax=Neobacillus mesonae TaxID=1193713 RepID=A0A3T0HYT2_9BACI|nr:hypothetical protein [Neobacillus mesonae]AZU62282.1 hypothetical protein CHR53_13860 [Neobacillus mesonae]
MKPPMNTEARKIIEEVHIEGLNEHESQKKSTKKCTLKPPMNTEARKIIEEVHIEGFNEHESKKKPAAQFNL